MAGGCNLNRPMASLVAESGLALGSTRSYYLERTPRIVGYLTEGVASKA
jgi:hypothetical protein